MIFSFSLFSVTYSITSLKLISYKPGVLFMVQNAASHLGLFCLFTWFSSTNEIKKENFLLLSLKMKVDSFK